MTFWKFSPSELVFDLEALSYLVFEKSATPDHPPTVSRLGGLGGAWCDLVKWVWVRWAKGFDRAWVVGGERPIPL